MRISQKQLDEAEKAQRARYTSLIMNDPSEARLRLIRERVNNPEVVKSYTEAVFGAPKLSASLMERTIGLVQLSQEQDCED